MRRVGRGLLVLAGAAALAGCGSSGSDSTAPPTTAATATGDGAAPSSEPTEIVPDARVTAGLADVRAHAAEVKAALGAEGQDAAKAHAREMYESWYGFEATVRQNDKDRYLQMEDGLADIQAGARDARAERIDRGIGDLEEGATAYLKVHP